MSTPDPGPGDGDSPTAVNDGDDQELVVEADLLENCRCDVRQLYQKWPCRLGDGLSPSPPLERVGLKDVADELEKREKLAGS